MCDRWVVSCFTVSKMIEASWHCFSLQSSLGKTMVNYQQQSAELHSGPCGAILHQELVLNVSSGSQEHILFKGRQYIHMESEEQMAVYTYQLAEEFPASTLPPQAPWTLAIKFHEYDIMRRLPSQHQLQDNCHLEDIHLCRKEML